MTSDQATALPALIDGIIIAQWKNDARSLSAAVRHRATHRNPSHAVATPAFSTRVPTGSTARN